MKTIHILDKYYKEIISKQVKSEEIGTRYTLVKGHDYLYEERVVKTIFPDFCIPPFIRRFRYERTKFPQ